MKQTLKQSLSLMATMTILTGIAYPLFVTFVSHAAFPHASSGSILIRDHAAVGSELIGQSFSDPRYFWSRPSAVNYDPMPSGGSNLAPTSDVLRQLGISRKTHFANAHRISNDAIIPPEMLLASGSGLDPHISPEAASIQLERVAASRHLDPSERKQLQKLVESMVEQRQFFLLGTPRINVLELNIALDTLHLGTID